MIKKMILKTDKVKLITAIQDLLRKGSVKTQEDIRKALHREGFEVNQAKISRVLHKLGAIKMPQENQAAYRLPVELISLTPKNSLNQLILSISRNDVLIVIHTTPGSAQLVARLLDHQEKIGILGTVAGDDTIFIAPKDLSKIEEVLQKVSGMLLG
jgi:transcriptional regulator of arginine metabolism